jgi:hypothetical protein
MHSSADRARVRELAGLGHSTSQLATIAGIPRSTVREWLAKWRCDPEWPAGTRQRRRVRGRATTTPPVVPTAPYAYLLGLYLGDGDISSDLGRFRLTLDSAYPDIIRSAVVALTTVAAGSRVGVAPRRGDRSVEVYAFAAAWPRLFPQHGPGPKHERRIELAPWQSAITRAHPRELVRGLIHSDGCRYVARQRKGARYYAYTRYSFSNQSPDIRRLYCEHLDLLGIRWTRSGTGGCQIAVATRLGVTQLDSFVGPKS